MQNKLQSIFARVQCYKTFFTLIYNFEGKNLISNTPAYSLALLERTFQTSLQILDLGECSFDDKHSNLLLNY